jgi:hypothetical protein
MLGKIEVFGENHVQVFFFFLPHIPHGLIQNWALTFSVRGLLTSYTLARRDWTDLFPVQPAVILPITYSFCWYDKLCVLLEEIGISWSGLGRSISFWGPVSCYKCWRTLIIIIFIIIAVVVVSISQETVLFVNSVICWYLFCSSTHEVCLF